MNRVALALAIVALALASWRLRTAPAPPVAPELHSVGIQWSHEWEGPMTAPANGSWSQTDWGVDPSNTGGACSDLGACTTAAPCCHLREIWRRMGTLRPIINVAMVITVESDFPDTTDPWMLRPTGTGTVVFTGDAYKKEIAGSPFTIGGLTNWSQAGGTPLKMTSWSGAAARQFVINTTHSSAAGVNLVTGGNAQLDVPQTIPTFNPASPPSTGIVHGAPVSTWANGDTIHVYQRLKIACGDLDMSVPAWIIPTDGGATLFSHVYFYRTQNWDPSGLGFSLLGDNFELLECDQSHSVVIGNAVIGVTWANVSNGCLFGGPTFPFASATASTNVSIWGGDVSGGFNAGIVDLQGDVMLIGTQVSTLGGKWSDVYVDTGTTVYTHGPVQLTGHVWGPGTLAARDAFFYSEGTAVSTFVGGLTLNLDSTDSSNAYGILGTGGTTYAIKRIALTPTLLDTAFASDGFAGRAFALGGSHGAFISGTGP